MDSYILFVRITGGVLLRIYFWGTSKNSKIHSELNGELTAQACPVLLDFMYKTRGKPRR
ncbi:MAG: hypothetical protein LBT09_12045 [Planctomycetaceae bacterium]|jgi:hypothetical protein|nr:hypothetical protein [Planctomycetaceae bacterium]